MNQRAKNNVFRFKDCVGPDANSSPAPPIAFDNHNVMARKMSVASSSRSADRRDAAGEVNQNDIPIGLLTPLLNSMLVPAGPSVSPLKCHSLGVSPPIKIKIRPSRGKSLPSSSTVTSRRSRCCIMIIYFSLYNVRP